MLAILRCAVFAAGLTFCGHVLGWGAAGHQTVGAIADALIAGTPAAAAVRDILGTSLARASVWADCAKGVARLPDGSFAYVVNPIYGECAVYESPDEQALMVEFVRRNWDACKPGPREDPCHKQYHYTNVAMQRDVYARNIVGTSDHDIVAAIDASIAVLQGMPSPAPFDLRDRREALRLLVHLVGDIHQPLHVASIYLDRRGRVVDPDAGTFDPRSTTRGGNDLRDNGVALHAQWDDVPLALTAGRFAPGALLAARAIAPAPGASTQWAQSWATDTLVEGRQAYTDLAYSPVDAQRRWAVTLPADYAARREALQRAQIVKAGARLAQVLVALFPYGPSSQSPARGDVAPLTR